MITVALWVSQVHKKTSQRLNVQYEAAIVSTQLLQTALDENYGTDMLPLRTQQSRLNGRNVSFWGPVLLFRASMVANSSIGVFVVEAFFLEETRKSDFSNGAKENGARQQSNTAAATALSSYASWMHSSHRVRNRIRISRSVLEQVKKTKKKIPFLLRSTKIRSLRYWAMATRRRRRSKAETFCQVGKGIPFQSRLK